MGERCFFLQGVTLGGSTMKAKDDKVDGGLRRHPKIGNDVELGSFVTIYGASNTNIKAFQNGGRRSEIFKSSVGG